jgi:hypothetical protein
MPSLARHLRAFVIAIAVLALSATVVLGARGLPALTAALTGSGTTADVTTADDQGEDADDQGEDADDPGEHADAPDEDAAEETDADAATDTDEPDAADEDGAKDAEAGDAPSDTHGAMVAEAAGMDTPPGFANHGAFVSCVARQNHGHLAPDATPIPLDQLTPADCAKDADEDAADEDGSTPDAAPTTTGKVKGKSASAHDKTPKGHGKAKRHGH